MLREFVLSMVGAALGLRPVPGADQLFGPSMPNIVWIGEMHGTKEQPALFGDLVACASQTGRPVQVILERSESEQPEWDAFLASEGSPLARRDFLKAPSWSWPVQDGRSSQAMLSLAERLRLLYRSHRILGVKLMVPTAKSDRPDQYEDEMSKVVERASRNNPKGITMVLSGNAHAKQGSRSDNGLTYTFAAGHLPPHAVTSVLIEGGPGFAWNCQNDCGPNATSGYPPHARAVAISNEKAGFDAIAWTGRPSSSSPPAAVSAIRVALPR